MAAESIAQSMPARAAAFERALGHDHPLLRLFCYALVAGAFFLIEHSWDAQNAFVEMISARSPEELATNEMFQTSSFRQLGAVALGAFGGLVLLITLRKERAPLNALGGLILFYLAWNALSLVWADDPGVTFRRFVMFATLCLGAYGVQSQLSLRQFTFFALLCPALFLGIGITSELYHGTLINRIDGYRFAGTLHPNMQAINCAIMLLAALSLYLSEKKGRLVFLAAIVVAAFFLYLTKSRTALAATGLVIAVYWTLQQSRGVRFMALAALVAGASGAMFLASVAQEQMGQLVKLGRTDLGESTGSFTGRVPVWEQAFEYAAERPFLGFGYGGFWNEERTTDFIDRQQWPVPHAHNAYIDVLLEAGPLAALAYMLILLAGVRRGFTLRAQTGNPAYGFLVLVLLLCAVNGLLESAAIQRTLVTFFCMIVLVALAFREPEPGPRPAA